MYYSLLPNLFFAAAIPNLSLSLKKKVQDIFWVLILKYIHILVQKSSCKMERDFMGLSSTEGAIETVFSSRQEVQWSWSSLESFQNRLSGDHQKNNSGGPHVSMDACRAPIQLTIFYGGTVNVYNDISPEKAQAIMLLAGNGAKEAAPRAPAHVSRPVSPALATPLSVGASASPGSIVAMDAPNSLRRMMQSAVPQMRGASLARFLQKRKERVIASAPYNTDKSSMDSGDKTGSSKD